MSTEPWTKVQVGVDCSPPSDMDNEERVCLPAKASESPYMLSQPLNELYRCPEKLLEIATPEHLSASAGYFRFGTNAICYGRSSGTLASRPESALRDTLGDVAVDDSKLRLPFHLNE